jgi:DNA-binding FadR family transcriptional regulator
MSAYVLAQVFGYALNTAQVDATHVIETRRAIEVQGAQLAARHITDAQKRLLLELVAQMRSALGDRDHARRMAADMAIHTTLAEASRNPLNPLLLAALRAPLEQLMHIDLGSRRTEAELVRIVDAHEAIVERVCAGDAVGAGSAMAMHFDLSVASMSRTEQASASSVRLSEQEQR